MYPKFFATALACAMATAALASEDAVVVVATRFPEKRLDYPIGVTVISREQIANSAARSLPELVARFAGVNTRDNSGSPDLAVDLRGFGASGDQNTLVLLDGQRLNGIELTPASWSSIPLEAVERVEIQRGGGAVLYGGGAAGGTINIITRSPIARARSAEVAASHGSYGSDAAHVGFNFSGADTGFALTAKQYDSDNYRSNNRLQQGNLLGDLRWTGDRAGLVFKFGLDNQKLRLPGARTAAQLESDRRGSATPNDYSGRDAEQATLSARYAFDAAELIADLTYRDTRRTAFFDDYSGFGFSTYSDTQAKVWAFTPRLKLPYGLFGENAMLIVGADTDLWDYHGRRAARLETLATPQAELVATQRDRGYYVQNHTTLGGGTRLTLGARVTRVEIAAEDRMNPAAYARTHQVRSPRAWEAALRKDLNSAWALYAKLGASFRVASVDEIYSQFGGPAFDSAVTALEPQTSRDREIGAEYKSGRTRLRAQLYRMELRNEIHFNAITFTNMNLSPTRREGLELELNQRVAQGLDLFASYTRARALFREGTYVDAMSGAAVDLAGRSVPLAPRASARAGLAWKLSDATRLSTALAYTGRQYFDNDQANTYPGQMPSYVTLDAKLVHVAGPWTFTLTGNNLTDKRYFSYAIRNAAGTSFNAYPMAGRSVLASLAYRWK